jgi:hypothetical protein
MHQEQYCPVVEIMPGMVNSSPGIGKKTYSE